MKKNPTIRDVAKASGVSVATVSRILNDKPDVSEETRQTVLQTINEIGYARRTQWQQITSGKSRVILLHYPRNIRVQNQISHEFIIGAAAACEEYGYSLQLMTQSLDENRLLDVYRSQKSDGIILMEIRLNDWRVELLRKNQLPFVMIGRCQENDGVSFIDLDFETAVSLAVDHLTASGHKHIGFVSIKPQTKRKRYGPAIRASEGYHNACEKHNLPNLYFEAGQGLQNIKEATLNFLNTHPETTAIVSASDMVLTGIINAVQTLGLQIPNDMSIIGLTNDQGAQMIAPSPTAIAFPSWMMGYEAGKLLIEKLEKGTADVVQNLIEPQLVIRDSSGPARATS